MHATKREVLIAPMDAAEASRKVQYVSRGSDIHRALLGLIATWRAGAAEVQITLDLAVTEAHKKGVRDGQAIAVQMYERQLFRARLTCALLAGAGCLAFGFWLGI